jgi:hypothetical protein
MFLRAYFAGFPAQISPLSHLVKGFLSIVSRGGGGICRRAALEKQGRKSPFLTIESLRFFIEKNKGRCYNIR